MPQEREHNYPHFTAEDWEAVRLSVAPREIKAARLIVASKVTGIPNRPYLNGDSDHAPVLQGVAEFAGKVYALLDALNDQPNMIATVEDAGSALYDAMENFIERK